MTAALAMSPVERISAIAPAVFARRAPGYHVRYVPAVGWTLVREDCVHVLLGEYPTFERAWRALERIAGRRLTPISHRGVDVRAYITRPRAYLSRHADTTMGLSAFEQGARTVVGDDTVNTVQWMQTVTKRPSFYVGFGLLALSLYAMPMSATAAATAATRGGLPKAARVPAYGAAAGLLIGMYSLRPRRTAPLPGMPEPVRLNSSERRDAQNYADALNDVREAAKARFPEAARNGDRNLYPWRRITNAEATTAFAHERASPLLRYALGHMTRAWQATRHLVPSDMVPSSLAHAGSLDTLEEAEAFAALMASDDPALAAWQVLVSSAMTNEIPQDAWVSPTELKLPA